MSEHTEADKESPGLERVRAMIDEVLAPLVRADQGELILLGRTGDTIEVALRGACAGCPGRWITVDKVLLPAFRAADPTVVAVAVRAEAP